MNNEDKRYYGIYRGVVTNADDPLEKGRVRLTVGQVLGDSETKWADCIDGAISQVNYPYGTFYTNANQTVTAANTETIAINWVEDDTNRMYLNNNKIYVQETGDYLLFFSVVASKTTAAGDQFDIWLKKNGTNLPNSNSALTLVGASNESVMTINFILDLVAGDYIEFAFSSTSATSKLTYHAPASSPTRPAVPGIIATLNLVGKYKPQVNTPVWVMFEGGDPNFPLWLGGQLS